MTQNNSGTIRVLFVDDDEIYRENTVKALNANPRLEVVAKATSGEEALEIADNTDFDVMLLDVTMPGLDGIETLQRLNAVHPNCVVLMLTAFERPESLQQALSSGARGFLTKESTVGEIREACEKALRGEQVLGTEPLKRITDFYVKGTPEVDEEFMAKYHELSPRHQKVVVGLAKGLTNREIARLIGVTEASATTYIKEALSQMGTRRVQLAYKAAKSGLL
ncbi:response regulator transcription factor [Mobiluncus porci]|uniref:Response regulator transcription factor n=1 Tax=Mobiluncus porci TaxID=2652278 RepID=A0A7K0K3Q5_9ACTO|nr:response regulator transcription factor [Mobiluncus porci]MST50117.1 response regulator transcription factor [Mobiluncus porci]